MKIRVGAQLHPQHCSMEELLRAARRCDELGVDSIFTWDHFYPLYGEADSPNKELPPSESPNAGSHFEGWLTLTAIACHTKKAQVGLLVGCNSYRNPELVADMARTLDHISGGRAILGLGSGWFERDYQEYGYEFGTAIGRLKDLGANLPRVKGRLAKLKPAPVQKELPLMIGGGGEKVTLRLVGEFATMWNGFGPPEEYQKKNAILDDWCKKAGRDPKEVERTVLVLRPQELDNLDAFVEAGAQHIIVGAGWPFEQGLKAVEKALEWRENANAATP